LVLDRIRKLSDNCTGLQGFLGKMSCCYVITLFWLPCRLTIFCF
jgi:hypothetical protein